VASDGWAPPVVALVTHRPVTNTNAFSADPNKADPTYSAKVTDSNNLLTLPTLNTYSQNFIRMSSRLTPRTLCCLGEGMALDTHRETGRRSHP
jgi:hypothetical protein